MKEGVVCQRKAKFNMTDRAKTRGQAKNETAPTGDATDIASLMEFLHGQEERRLQREEDRRAEESGGQMGSRAG